MSRIRKYRLNYGDIVSTVEFYIKVEQKKNKILCNFCFGDDGLYYYRAKSQILSPKENRKTRFTWDGFISMENLRDLFDNLKVTGLNTIAEVKGLKVRRERRKVILEAK